MASQEHKDVAVLKFFLDAALQNPSGDSAANEMFQDVLPGTPFHQQLEHLASVLIFGCLDNKHDKFFVALLAFMECRSTAQFSGAKANQCLLNTYPKLTNWLYSKYSCLQNISLSQLPKHLRMVIHFVLKGKTEISAKLRAIVKYLIGVCLFIDATQRALE